MIDRWNAHKASGDALDKYDLETLLTYIHDTDTFMPVTKEELRNVLDGMDLRFELVSTALPWLVYPGPRCERGG